ncbi:MAG TPA: uracil-DNA glycosylase family protein [Burkholderiales bacterium]|jgi:uracil-DNA glycosylase|nr:uracil-DNA glycosylase family protein [Burkholderiales bacterium]
MRISLRRVSAEALACRRCSGSLEPKPVFRARAAARLLIVGQAPGRRVHETGIPWNDPSGNVLRDWLAMDRETFYDATRIAIVPVGLCYPGTVEGADLPPSPRCAPLWQPKFRAALPRIELTLLVGSYAQRHYLGARRKGSLTETVRAFEEYLPEFFPLPHPSWRNLAWRRKHPWFERRVLPVLRQRVAAIIARSA